MKFFGKMGMTFTGTEGWLVLLSLADGLGVVKSVSLEFFLLLIQAPPLGYFSLMSKNFVVGSNSM